MPISQTQISEISNFFAPIYTNKSETKISFRNICRPTLKNFIMESLHSYPGRMLGEIPLLTIPYFCDGEDRVLDTFCGSGTTLRYSKMFGVDSFGVDINPLCILISKVNTNMYDISNIYEKEKCLFEKIKSTEDAEIPVFENIDFWFDVNIKKDLAKIRKNIYEMKNDKYRDFFLVCFSDIIRSVSNADPDIAPPVKSKKMRNLIIRGRKINAIEKFNEKVNENILKTIRFQENVSDKKCITKVLHGDARKLPFVENFFDMIITSPPYFDAQKYFRSTKHEMLWLGLLKEDAIRKLDGESIGTERISSKKITAEKTGYKKLDCLVDSISYKNPYRSYCYYRYFTEMERSIHEMTRVLEKSGKLLMLVGDNNVCGINTKSHEIFIEMCKKHGLKLEKKMEDEIKSYSFMTKRNKTAGIIKSEWLLVFKRC